MMRERFLYGDNVMASFPLTNAEVKQPHNIASTDRERSFNIRRRKARDFTDTG